MKNFFSWIFDPRYWMRNEKTSKSLTDFINNQLDNGVVPVIVNEFEMTLSGVNIWRANFPYAYGNIYSRGVAPLLPSRSTVVRLRKAEIAAEGSGNEDKIKAAVKG